MRSSRLLLIISDVLSWQAHQEILRWECALFASNCKKCGRASYQLENSITALLASVIIPRIIAVKIAMEVVVQLAKNPL